MASVPRTHYVFWRYDKYPHLLGGIATKFRGGATKEPTAFISAYGRRFHYKFLLPHKKGKGLLKALEELRDMKRAAYETVDREYEWRLAECMRIYQPHTKGDNRC